MSDNGNPLPLTPVRRAGGGGGRPPDLHSALYAALERQGGEVRSDAQARVGLCPRLVELDRALAVPCDPFCATTTAAGHTAHWETGRRSAAFLTSVAGHLRCRSQPRCSVRPGAGRAVTRSTTGAGVGCCNSRGRRAGQAPFAARAVDGSVGPALDERANEALCLSVGSRAVGLGQQVPDPEAPTGGRVGLGAITAPVVGHRPLDCDASLGEPGDRSLEEAADRR